MSTFDFPPELWTEIISYLPKHDLRKMIGVNRLLFELALNDIYEEVRLTSDDSQTAKVFDQLRQPNICTRARRLFIRPTFLAPMEDIKTPLADIFSFKLSSYINGIAKKSPLDRFTLRKTRGILSRAQTTIKSCASLDEVTIILHDHALTLQFMAFLDSLWSSSSVGPHLRKITIDTTVVKLPILLNSLLKRAKVLSKLEAFDITISTSQFEVELSDWDAATGSLVAFLNAFRHALTSLTFSSLLDWDISSLFTSFPHLRKLQTFALFSVFNAAIFPNTQSFTRFISMHASTLQNLVIKPHARCASLTKPDISYTAWLSPSAVTESKSLAAFPSLVLPELRTLDLGLGECWNKCGTARQYRLPDFSRVAPNLTSLVLTETKLTTESVAALLDILAQRTEGSHVENLVFSCYVIFPELFDLLYKSVPNLKSLSIQHISYIPVMGNVNRYRGRSDVVFAEKLNSRTYPESRLQYVRLASPPGSCGETHPNRALMKILARSFPSSVVLDTRAECQCLL